MSNGLVEKGSRDLSPPGDGTSGSASAGGHGGPDRVVGFWVPMVVAAVGGIMLGGLLLAGASALLVAQSWAYGITFLVGGIVFLFLPALLVWLIIRWMWRMVEGGLLRARWSRKMAEEWFLRWNTVCLPGLQSPWAGVSTMAPSTMARWSSEPRCEAQPFSEGRGELEGRERFRSSRRTIPAGWRGVSSSGGRLPLGPWGCPE